jgi:NADH-quinone oxidoreductase subunit E
MLAVKTNSQVKFSDAAHARAKEIISRYPEGKSKSALIPLLMLAQDENDNWLSVEAQDFIANMLGLQPIEAYEVASFYSMFNLKPVGRYLLEVCHTGPCAIRGAEKMLSQLENKLGIRDGQTTPDGMFTIKRVECLAACGYAPMLQLGENYIEHLDTEEKVDKLISDLRNR